MSEKYIELIAIWTSYLGMRTGRPKKPLEIVDADPEKLSRIARRPKSAQGMALRARMVLSCGEGMSDSEVARRPYYRRDRGKVA